MTAHAVGGMIGLSCGRSSCIFIQLMLARSDASGSALELLNAGYAEWSAVV
jgi:hypothetical protein